MTTPILARLRYILGSAAHIDVMTEHPYVFQNNPHVNHAAPVFSENDYEHVWDLNGAYERAPQMHAVDAYMHEVFGDAKWPAKDMFLDSVVPSGIESVDWPRAITIHPATSDRNRTFKPEFWKGVIQLLRDHDLTPIVLGTSASAVKLGSPEIENCVNFVDRLTIHEAAAVIGMSACFVTGDTGLMHVAGTTNCSIVGLFTAVLPSRRMPWRHGIMGWKVKPLVPPLDCVGCISGPGCRRGDFACVDGTQSVAAEQVLEAVLETSRFPEKIVKKINELRNPVVAHIQDTGDVSASLGEWIGQYGKRLEGFAVASSSELTPGDISYQVEFPDGTRSEWCMGGEFCGTRHESRPLLGLRVRLSNAAGERLECVYWATFSDGREVGPCKNGELCGGTAEAALETTRIVVRPRMPDRPVF